MSIVTRKIVTKKGDLPSIDDIRDVLNISSGDTRKIRIVITRDLMDGYTDPYNRDHWYVDAYENRN